MDFLWLNAVLLCSLGEGQPREAVGESLSVHLTPSALCSDLSPRVNLIAALLNVFS